MPQSIIQSKTYAETEAIFALATGTYNNTYAGTEIYVSDKSWHLLCYYDREAKPKSGVLKINNGDTLPNWLTPELIEVDFGTITSDISVTGVEIDLAATYYPILLVAKNLEETTEPQPIHVVDSLGVNVLTTTDIVAQNETVIAKGGYITESKDGIKVKHPYTLMATGNGGLGIQVKVIMQLLPAF